MELGLLSELEEGACALDVDIEGLDLEAGDLREGFVRREGAQAERGFGAPALRDPAPGAHGVDGADALLEDSGAGGFVEPGEAQQAQAGKLPVEALDAGVRSLEGGVMVLLGEAERGLFG